MSNRRSRRLQNSPLKNNPAPSDAAKFAPITSKDGSLKGPPEDLLAAEKPDVLEHYKVEDRIQADDAVSAPFSGVKVDAFVSSEDKNNVASVEASNGASSQGVSNAPSGVLQSNQASQQCADETKFDASSGKKEQPTSILEVKTAANNNIDASPAAALDSKSSASATPAENEGTASQQATSATEEEKGGKEELKSTPAPPIRRHRTRSTSSASAKATETSGAVCQQVTSTTLEEEKKGEEPPAAEKEADTAPLHPIRRHRTRSLSSASAKATETSGAASQQVTNATLEEEKKGEEPPAPAPAAAAAAAEKEATNDAPVHPIRRHRTRSTSSALSSISGESHEADPTTYQFDNDGKTPLIANRRTKRSNSVHSQGPIRKRHKGRALFGADSGAPNTLSSDPPLFQDELLNNDSEDLLASLPRSRSNTMDSFRAAMESNELSESVVLPEIKTTLLEGTKPRTDSVDFMTSPRGRSDTIDFLTAAVGGDLDESSYNGNELACPPSPIRISGDSGLQQKDTMAATVGNNRDSLGNDARKGKIEFGKTPKKNNLSGEPVINRDPIKKRYRTRSLSYDPNPAVEKSDQLGTKEEEEVNEDDIATASLGSGPRSRSNTLESFTNALMMGRSRSDTMDFLTAAVAGDMGHDLDAALAAATSEGASFAMHPISAPSGASSHFSNSHHTSNRSRSNTLDSATSSVNSSKLDFLVSVAAEEGLGLLSEEKLRDRTGSMSETSAEHIQRRSRSNTLEMYSSIAAGRGRSDTIDFLVGAGNDHAVGDLDDVVTLPDDNNSNGCVLDHLKALCGEPTISGNTKTTGILRRGRLSSEGNGSNSNTVTSPKAKFDDQNAKRTRANSEHTNPSNSAGSSSQRLVMEALQYFEDDRRERNDSWGGMSDLSVTGIAATHDALKSTGIIDDLMAAAADLGDDLSEEPPEKSERKRSTSGGSNSLGGKGRRPRVDSLASLSLASLSDASISVAGRKEQYASELVQKLPESASKASTVGSQSIVVDYEAIAAAVSATEGLDLNSILSSPSAAKHAASVNDPHKPNALSLGRKTTPMTKVTSKSTNLHPSTKLSVTPKPNPAARLTPMPSRTLGRPLPLKYQPTPKHLMKTPPPFVAQSAQKSLVKRVIPLKPNLPLPASQMLKPKPPLPKTIDIPIPKSTKTEAEMEAIRQRARAAAGYTPPGTLPIPSKPGCLPGKLPPKRFTAPPLSMPPPSHPNNIPLKKRPNGLPPPLPPPYIPSMSIAARPSSLQAQQKWDDMFDYLVKFIEDTRVEETKGLTEEEKKSWVWDGNVPTNYKTPCGKALGRWINNQRTSKTKGTLKDDRELRLVSTGLKWSVLTTNSWNEMLRELEIYAEDKRKGGKEWDGNVPTNYKITVQTMVNGRKTEEEKNLGRWVNRQRSLFQAGKLKKDRQADLERVGLKWSVLMVPPWSMMYECLCNYAKERRAENNGVWDGNVPSNWRVETRPPVNLGRWVNRQRCAYAKRRLKPEYVTKLDQAGLKWTMHDQKRPASDFDEDDFEGEEFIPKPECQGKTPPKILSQNILPPTKVVGSACPASTAMATPLQGKGAPDRVLSMSIPLNNRVVRPAANTLTTSAPLPKTLITTTPSVAKGKVVISSLPPATTKIKGPAVNAGIPQVASTTTKARSGD